MNEIPETEPAFCDVDFVHAETVEKIRANSDHVEGAGELLGVLADDTRLKVIWALSQAELCVCDVAAATGVSKAVASYHLRLLYRLGLAAYRKEGRMAYYRLADHNLRPVVTAALEFARGRNGGGHEGSVHPIEVAAGEPNGVGRA